MNAHTSRFGLSAAALLLALSGCAAYDRAAGTNTSGVYPQQRDGTQLGRDDAHLRRGVQLQPPVQLGQDLGPGPPGGADQEDAAELLLVRKLLPLQGAQGNSVPGRDLSA